MNDNEKVSCNFKIFNKNFLSKSLEGKEFIDRSGNSLLNANLQTNFNTFTNNYKGTPTAYKSPFGMTFENENFIRHYEKKKYKEDLDYLLNLKKQMSEDEFEKRYGEEFRRKIQLMNEKFNLNRNEQKNFMKGLKRDYETEILHHRDDIIQKKHNELEVEKKYLDYINNQNYLENQRKLEQKLKAKNETLTDLDHFYQKKQMEEQMKKADMELSQKLMVEESKRMTNRELEYRNKINSMNEKIYRNGQKFTDLVNINNSTQLNELFNVCDDFKLNKKLAEMKALERDSTKRDPIKIQERLNELQKDREIDNKMKTEKIDHQKLYKEYLDFQNSLGNEKKQTSINDNFIERNRLIMPSYDYPNRPIPTGKMANDSIDWVKHNHTETLRSGKHYYLGDTILRHNPITQPIEDISYNKYLNKQRNLYGVNKSPSNSSSNTLAMAGNKVLI